MNKEQKQKLKEVDENIKQVVKILESTRGLTSILMDRFNEDLEELRRQAEYSINAFG